MKKIIIYAAYDNTRFDNESDCEEYEKLCEKVADCFSYIKEPPKNDSIRVKHDTIILDAIANVFMLICREQFPKSAKYFNNYKQFLTDANNIIISRSGIKCLEDGFDRLCKIDFESGYEYHSVPYINNKAEWEKMGK